jgi:tetratricopeptide (TPR) repeat protein
MSPRAVDALELMRRRDFAGAEAALRAILREAPDDFGALHLLAGVRREQEALDEALALLERAVALRPEHAIARLNLGIVLSILDRHGEALPQLELALARRPDLAEARYRRGVASHALGRRDEALADIDAALALRPGDVETILAKCALLMTEGRYREAWPLYAARWRDPKRARPRLATPPWRGARVPLLRVWGEQGVGDEILFARLALLARERVDALELYCAPRLAPLFARSFADFKVASVETLPNEPGVAHAAAGDLGAALDIAPEALGGGAPFLSADAQRVASMRARYERLAQGRKIIGVAWHSNPKGRSVHKSAPLGEWGALLDQPYFFVNLQYGAAANAADAARLYSDADVDQMRDLDSFAAQIAALDAVVTVSNTTAHMAGALGVRCFVLAPPAQGLHWYWGAAGETTPWYASVRVIRRGLDEPWRAQIVRAAAALREEGLAP